MFPKYRKLLEPMGENIKLAHKRIVFNICVFNTDDHLRNHSFLLNNNGWYLLQPTP